MRIRRSFRDWMLGGRDAGVASPFLYDLHQRLATRVQLTSDGHGAYLQAVDYAWGGMNIDYAMLVKLYGESPEAEKRYSPARCIGCKRHAVDGDPDDIWSDHLKSSQVTTVDSIVRFFSYVIRSK